MSLIVMYKDEMASDRLVLLKAPHANGQSTRTAKMRVANNKTFAFSTVGTTLTTLEKDVLENIIASNLDKQDHLQTIDLEHQDWFRNRTNIELFVMTKNANFHLVYNKARNKYGLEMVEVDQTPALHGSGLYAAFIALSEGVPMLELMPLVSDVVNSISDEFDYIHRKDLVELP